ncbi:MAG: ELM1/GtrOC1 family putative glycosyltransferase [Candidatus Omnitrophica bacterium]|nr:ELM1/GtrOC1 family putative glycosyltransferase [Candidatus Omnitrophota bacterium]MDD5351832.1 ELM1/GtrOC1 family putative glycosyltransferase [Candidatus Omnitrophota bacterium]MDD5550658.1 ELM1/GtrOC1 family putative glycosyltransferase [Candidatus Omnitrophota bacterium]
MKKNSLIDYCLYLIAKVITAIVRFVPIGFSIFIIRTQGALAFYLLRRKRSIAYKNLKIAFPHYTCDKINRIIKLAFMNYAQHFIEIFYLPWMDQSYIDRFIEFDGLEEVLNVMQNKKGSIFLCLHEGSWEVGNVIFSQALKEHDYTILARTQPKIPYLNQLLNEYRAKRNCKILTIDDNLRPIVECLKKGLSVGMVADHGAQGGIFVDFFGRPALTPTGAMKLALKLDTNLFYGFIKRQKGGRHKITIRPYNLVRTEDADKDLKLNLENINRKYEEFISESPQEYLWFFKRWKYSPQRNILVLSDGKPGHLKQSLAVLDLIKTLPFQVKSNLVEIKFKNNLQKLAFNICAFFFSSSCQGCMQCLRRLLDPDDSRKLLSSYYDVVISCGSGLSMLNRLVAFENMAKSIIVMKPGMFSLKRFDLVIVPEHDDVIKLSNLVLIKGALAGRIDSHKERIDTIINDNKLNNPPLSRPVIGLLLGGSNKYLFLDKDTVAKTMDSLDDFVDEIGGSVLVSTSRRTGRNIEQFLKERLVTRPKYRMLIIASEHNPPGSLEAILHLSDILVVSGDSISMVSEAVNSGKHVVVFRLNRKIPVYLSKHERFIDNLGKDEYVYVASAENLSNILAHLWKHKPLIRKINDEEIILDRLKQII